LSAYSFEEEFSPGHRHIKREDSHRSKISAGVRVTELRHKLNYPFLTGDYVTPGRLINHRPGRIAGVGDQVQLEGICLEVLKMDRRCNAGRRQAAVPNCLADRVLASVFQVGETFIADIIVGIPIRRTPHLRNKDKVSAQIVWID